MNIDQLGNMIDTKIPTTRGRGRPKTVSPEQKRKMRNELQAQYRAADINMRVLCPCLMVLSKRSYWKHVRYASNHKQRMNYIEKMKDLTSIKGYPFNSSDELPHPLGDGYNGQPILFDSTKTTIDEILDELKNNNN